MKSPSERDLFLAYLRKTGRRVTAERRALCEEIFRRHGHVDAADLHSEMLDRGVKISRATVYRNLDLLVECGLVRKHRLGSDRYLYEHVHPGQQHDHLVCRECGRVVEFTSPGIRALQREISKAHGFDPTEQVLSIWSFCVECRKAERDRRPAPAETVAATA